MLKYFDSFDNTVQGNSGAWSATSPLGRLGWSASSKEALYIAQGEGRRGSNMLFMTYNYSPKTLTLARSATRLVVGFSWRPGSVSANDQSACVAFRYGTFTNFIIGWTRSTYGITFWFNTGADTGAYPVIAGSAYVSVPFSADTWTFIELFIDVADFMNGRVKCAVNGQTVYDQSGLVVCAHLGFGSNPYDARAKLDTIAFGGIGTVGQWYTMNKIDSIYVADDEGGYQNDFLGDITVAAMRPTRDGDHYDFSPFVNGVEADISTPRYGLIDDLLFNPASETEFIQADQDMLQELMSFEPIELPVDSDLIAINHRTALRNVASPGLPRENSITPLYKSSGNDTIVINSLTKRYLGWEYNYQDIYYPIVPGFAIPWTKLLVDGSQFGFLLKEAIWTGNALEDISIDDLLEFITYYEEDSQSDFGVMDDAAASLTDIAEWDDLVNSSLGVTEEPDYGDILVEDGFGISEEMPWQIKRRAPRILMHFDGVDQSHVFTDESGKVWTQDAGDWTRIQSLVHVMGDGALISNNTNNYDRLSTPDHADFVVGDLDHCVDFWFNSTASKAGSFLYQGNNALLAGVRHHVFIGIDGKLGWCPDWAGGRHYLYSPNAVNDGIWHHCAFIRFGNTWTIYVDGVPVTTATFTYTGVSSGGYQVFIGREGYGDGWHGYLDELRYTLGHSRWHQRFRPPIEAGTMDEPWSGMIYDWHSALETVGLADEIIDE